MGGNAEPHSGSLPGWVPILACIIALVYLVWAFHGLTWLTDHQHQHQSPAHYGNVRVTETTIPTLRSPLTPTTNSPTIVPLPAQQQLLDLNPSALVRSGSVSPTSNQPGDPCPGFIAQPGECWQTATSSRCRRRTAPTRPHTRAVGSRPTAIAGGGCGPVLTIWTA